MSEKKVPVSVQKKERIIEVAGQMFMAQGFGGVSMDAIAEAAPVSKPTLYNHFADKKALFAAVMARRCQGLFMQLQESLGSEKSPRGALTGFGQQFLDLIMQPDARSMYRIALTEAQSFPELGKLFYESGPKRSTEILATYLEAQHKTGILKVPDAELAANIFFGMLTNRLHMRYLLGIKKNVGTAEKEEIVRMAVDIFLNGLAK